ncbi:MAG: tyrosine recombinase XerC [Prevotella sp.]|nr:tyrosine recombinase XerC [Prevotella sp.]
MMVEQFLNYLRYERGASPMTVQSYGEDLKAFESYFNSLDCQLSWESVDSDVIRLWMESMMDKGNTATSIKRRLSALRSFYRFALIRKKVTVNPARVVKGPKASRPLPQFLRESEMEKLLDDDEMWCADDYKDMRARTIITLFYETGIRLSELIGLDDASVDLAGCHLKVLGKGNKQRVIPFGNRLKQTLEAFVEFRNSRVARSCDALFVTEKGDRMSAPMVREEVKKNISKVSTLKKRTPHVLRHTFATAMVNHEAGIESVKKLLGHESIGTTEIYSHTTFEQLKRVYKQAHPRA